MSSDEQKKQLISQKLYRSLKSKQRSTSNDQESVSPKKSKSSTLKTVNRSKESEADLTNRAIEEIRRETERASRLAEEIGPSGWRVKTQRTNKRFLANTMRSVLSHNERTSVKHAKESKRKFQELSKRPPKFGARLHSFQSSEERMTKEKTSNNLTT